MMYFDVSRGKLNGIFAYLYKKHSSDFENYVKVNGTGASSNNIDLNPLNTLIPGSQLYFVGRGNDYNV